MGSFEDAAEHFKDAAGGRDPQSQGYEWCMASGFASLAKGLADIKEILSLILAQIPSE